MAARQARLIVFTIAAGYVFAIGAGVWLANAACFAPRSITYGIFVGLAIAALAILLVQLRSASQALIRIPVAAGLIATVILVRLLSTPLFPGIDYDGPVSLDSYLFNVQLEWQFGHYFGSCSGLLSRNELR